MGIRKREKRFASLNRILGGFLFKRLAVSALLVSGVHFMCADGDGIQSAVLFIAVVIGALFYSTFNSLFSGVHGFAPFKRQKLKTNMSFYIFCKTIYFIHHFLRFQKEQKLLDPILFLL